MTYRNAMNLSRLERQAAELPQLTDKQFDAWFLWNREAGYKRVGELLCISKSSARGRIERARLHIDPLIEYEEAA